MESTNIINTVYKIKDISKGQKIVAALYLATGHLSDNDPIKSIIREFAVSLIISTNFSEILSSSDRITLLLESASIAGIVSEKNTSIIISELKNFITKENTGASISMKSFFEDNMETPSLIKKTSSNQSLSFKNQSMSVIPKKSQMMFENKNKRQQDILSFINQKKSVGIKDISSLLSDISEKTIQRELNLLVQNGLITKRGTKRWSTYMAVIK